MEIVGGRDHGRQRRHGFGGVPAELWVEGGPALDGPVAACCCKRSFKVTIWIYEQFTTVIIRVSLNTDAGGLATAQPLALLERPRALVEVVGMPKERLRYILKGVTMDSSFIQYLERSSVI